nr:hypothetical protein [Candidatus Sigynarchaeota archaeon]
MDSLSSHSHQEHKECPACPECLLGMLAGGLARIFFAPPLTEGWNVVACAAAVLEPGSLKSYSSQKACY